MANVDSWQAIWSASQSFTLKITNVVGHEIFFGILGWQLQPNMVHTVYPKKYAHGFCFAVLCCGSILTDFPISTRLTSLALWQSNDCPSASKATLMNMDKYFMWIHYERLHNHNKAKHNKTVCIFLGIYCISCRGCTNNLCNDFYIPRATESTTAYIIRPIKIFIGIYFHIWMQYLSLEELRPVAVLQYIYIKTIYKSTGREAVYGRNSSSWKRKAYWWRTTLCSGLDQRRATPAQGGNGTVHL